jgi:dienelactone hydrolase
MKIIHGAQGARQRRWATALVSVLGLTAYLHAQAQAPATDAPATATSPAAPIAGSLAAERIAADLREEVQRLPVTVRDMFGREESHRIALTVFRPAGDGPFPLVVMSHGRANQDRRAEQNGRQRFETLARYLVQKGFVVMVPTRVGYGDTFGGSTGQFDPEDAGGCNNTRPEAMALAASSQVLAAVEHGKTLPYVDTTRWVAMGVSVGGLTTLAVASRNPPGLVAAINFAGGTNGNPVERPGQPCGTTALETLWRKQAATAPVPMLWLYWQHDLYWGAKQPLRWAAAWKDGGGTLDFHMLPPWGTEPADGHNGLGADMNTWVPLVEAYLAKVGFTRSGLVERPPASGFAQVAQVEAVPIAPDRRTSLYARFLQAKSPRAFAIGPGGVAAWAAGDWAAGRALGNCQWRSGKTCKLYAVDDDVVWKP